MGFPVLPVDLCQLGRFQDQQVLCVPLLGCLGEVEAARDDHPAINDHDLVVSDGVCSVDPRRNASTDKERHAAIAFGPLALVEDHPHINAMIVGSLQGARDRRAGEAIGLDQNHLPGAGYGSDHGILGTALRTEIDLRGGVLQDQIGRPGAGGRV